MNHALLTASDLWGLGDPTGLTTHNKKTDGLCGRPFLIPNRAVRRYSGDTPAEAMYHAFCVRAKRARTSSVTVAAEAAAVKSCVTVE